MAGIPPTTKASSAGKRATSTRGGATCPPGFITNDAVGTVTFHLGHADPDFLYKLALLLAAPAPPGAPDHAIDRAPFLPGTGPYKISQYRPNVSFTRHVLLISGPSGDLQPKMHPWQDQVDVVIEANSRTDRPGLGPTGNVYLLRPDGYVAVRGSVIRPESLLDYLHRLFGPPEHGEPPQLPHHPA